MKPRCSNQRNHALTLAEVLVVIAVLFVVAIVLFQAINQRPHLSRAESFTCVNNLKQVDLAYHIWAGDHGGKYPMEISVSNGGTMELAVTGDVVATFQIMSNELITPKILICRQDKNHIAATNFESGFSAKNISYFVCLDVNTNSSQVFLSGDDNFAIDGLPVKSGLTQFPTNIHVAWTPGRHAPNKEHFWSSTRGKFFGNIVFADGSVQSTTSPRLHDYFQQTGLATNRLAIP